MEFKKNKIVKHPIWNIFLLTIGGLFITIGVQSIAAPHGFLTGGTMGLGLLISYNATFLSASVWNLILNIPLLIFAWISISKRFVLYSVYGTVIIAVWSSIIGSFVVPIDTNLYAAILSGMFMGIGNGIMLRSLGSSGGLDLVSVFLNQRFGIAMGMLPIIFNTFLFGIAAFTIDLDLIIVSFIQVFILLQVIDYVLGMFNRRKTVFIITSKGQEICNAIAADGGRATLLPAYGAYTQTAKEVIMTVTTNLTLRSLENLVFSYDSHALFTVESTFYVSGAQFARVSK